MDRAIAIFVFFILAVLAGILVVPSFVDWNTYRPEIEAYAEDLTGRDVTIAGDIGFQLLPTPALTLENFSIANHPDAAAGDMINLKRLEVLAALRPLILGQLQITNLRLVQPTFAVELFAGDQSNWDLGDNDPRIPPVLKERPWWLQRLADAMRFDNVSVEDGSVTYSDGANGLKTIVRKLNAEISAASLNGPFDAKGAASFRGVDVSFDWNSGDTSRIRAVPLRLNMEMKPSSAVLAFRGFMDEASLFGPIQGQLSFDAAQANDGLNDLFSMINGVRVAKTKGTAAKALSQDLRIEADFSINGRDLKAANLVMGLNGVRAMGEITGTFGRRPTFAAKLESRSVNLDSLLGEKHETPKSVNLERAPDEIEKELKGFLVPKNVTGTIDIGIDGIIYRAGVIQNFTVRGKAANGAIDILEATGTLPGKTKLKVQGTWSPATGGTKFAGEIDVMAGNPRALANWMGLESASLKSDKLQELSIQGEVESAPGELSLKDADVVLDGQTYRVSAGQKGDTGSGMSVSIEGPSLDLDSYAPLLPEGLRGSQWPKPLNAPDFEIAPKDQDFDVNLNLEDLTWNGSTYRSINAQFSSLDGLLSVDRFEVGNVNGAKIKFSGRGRGTFSKPDFSVQATIEAADLSRFFQTIGLAPGTWFGGVGGQLTLTGELSNEVGEIVLEATLDGLGGLPTQLDGVIARADGAYTISVERLLSAPHSRFAFSLLPGESGASRVVLSGAEPDLAALIASWGLQYDPADPSLGPLTYEAMIDWRADVANITSLTVSLGPLEAQANGRVDVSDDAPEFDATIALSAANLNDVLPSGDKDFMPAIGDPAEGGQSLQANLLSREATQTDGILGWLSTLTGSVDLTATTLQWRNYGFRNLSAQIGTGGGQIAIKDIAGTLFDGKLDGDLVYTAADLLPELKGQLSLASAEARDLQRTFFSLDPTRVPLDGNVDLRLAISALGRNPATLLATLNGDAEVTAGEMTLRGLDLNGLENAVAEATGLEEFRELSKAAIGQGLVAIKSLTGLVSIEDGRLRGQATEDQPPLTALLAPQSGGRLGDQMIFSGDIDLNTSVMNGQAALTLTAYGKAPPLTLRLTGPVAAPTLQVESTALGSYFIDDFAKRADQVAKSEMDKEIDLLKSAIDRLDAQTESETPESETTN